MKRYFILALLILIAPPATMERIAPPTPIRLSLDLSAPLAMENDWAPEPPIRRDREHLDLRSFEVDDIRVRVNVRLDGMKVTGTWRY